MQELSITNLQIKYGEQVILTDLNHTFKKGAVNLIVGRAGSGKTSLLLALAGFLKYKLGTILADAEPFKPHGQFSLAFQSPESLFFNPTVGDEVCFALLAREMEAQVAIESAKTWLEKWGLDADKYWDKSTLALSGGEKRRVALAACTVFKPPLIMLDEPLAGLDIKGQINLANLIEEIAHESCVLVVTHEPEIFLRPETNLLFIKEGRGERYSGLNFYNAAIADEEFYPLPRWFQQTQIF